MRISEAGLTTIEDPELVSLGVKYDTALAEYVNYTDGAFNKWLRQHRGLAMFSSILVLSLPMFLGICLYNNEEMTIVTAFGFVIFSFVIMARVLNAELKYNDDKRKYQLKAKDATTTLCRAVVRGYTGKQVDVNAVVVDEGEDGVAAHADFTLLLLNISYYPTSELFTCRIEGRYGSEMIYEDTDLMQLVKRAYEIEILPQLNVFHIGVPSS